MPSILKVIQVARWPLMLQPSHDHSQVNTTGRVKRVKTECFQVGTLSAYISLAAPIFKRVEKGSLLAGHMPHSIIKIHLVTLITLVTN